MCTYSQKNRRGQKVNVAILGFGTVGSGVYEILKQSREHIAKKTGEEINVKYILDVRDFSSHPEAHLFVNDINIILNDESVDVVCEVIGGVEPSLTFSREALLKGKSVITSNKELVAKHGTALMKTAKENGAIYLFEAAVGGGIPLIRPIYRCLAGNRITKIMGILNGTTNYILTKMFDEGQSFDEALSDAQAKGYAERNPAADVEGHDTCRKIAILSSLVYGKNINADLIETEGIVNIDAEDVQYAEMAGGVIKLVGYSEIGDKNVYARVSPMLLPNECPLSSAKDVFNAALCEGDSVGEVMFYGKGAGKLPTASSVVGDIIDICMNKNAFMSWDEGEECDVDLSGERTCGLFVRVLENEADAFGEKYKTATRISGVKAGECAFIIPSISIKEAKGINAVKKIYTQENYVI